MAKISTGLRRIVVGVVVVAIVAGGVFFIFFRGSSDRSVTAKFAQAVGIYPGTPVKILGVNVGKVTSVVPDGTTVKVKMSYMSDFKLPADAKAVEVANSLVSDRYIELTPAYKNGDKVMSDGATISEKNTGAPAELDDINDSLNKLSLALGPKGANKGGKQNGALSTLLKVGAANLKGNGAAIGNSVTQLSKAAQTLAGSRGNLFKTVENLRKFTGALKSSDADVRKFNLQLAQVAGQLAGERGDLGAALHDLGIALDTVHNFVKKNAGKLHTTIGGLRDITSLLVRQKSSLEETLSVAPIALANIVHSYNPQLGALATRGNNSSLTDPAQFCTLLQTTGVLGNNPVGTLVDELKAPVFKQLNATCNTLVSQLGPGQAQQVIDKLKGLVGDITGGSLPTGGGGLPTGGGGLTLGGLPSFPIGGNS